MRLEGIVLRRDFGVLTVSVQAKKGLVKKTDRQAAGVLEQALASKLL